MKRIFSLAAALALVCSLSLAARANSDLTLALSRGEGRVGEEVSLTLDLQDNPGIVSVQVQVSYDTEKLRLISVTDGGILGDEIHHQESLVSPYTLSWENYTAKLNFVENGTLCTLTFRILDGAEGEEIPVVLYAGDYGVMNYNLADLPRTLVDGGVTVTGGSPLSLWLPWVAAVVCMSVPVVFLVTRKKTPEKETKA